MDLEGLVSVIIPAYNRQMYIKECLESVLAQSYENFEILVVDDGSSDQTVEICRNMAQADPRIRLYEGEHKGVSPARNLAIEKAQGEYVLFVDSDDIIHPKLIEQLVCRMDDCGAQMGGTFCYAVTEHNWDRVKEKFLSQNIIGESEYLEFDAAIKALFCRITPISLLGGVMIRRDWIGETRFRSDLTIGEDFYFVYENLAKGASVIFMNNRWYMNRFHQTNSSWDYSYTGFMTRFRRRELVWQNEEHCGRQANVKQQKWEAFGNYLRCLKHNRLYGRDCKMMRKTLRKYQKTLLPAISWKRKILFLAVVYFPFTGVMLNKMKNSIAI